MKKNLIFNAELLGNKKLSEISYTENTSGHEIKEHATSVYPFMAKFYFTDTKNVKEKI